jgi:hypothetical protein
VGAVQGDVSAERKDSSPPSPTKNAGTGFGMRDEKAPG